VSGGVHPEVAALLEESRPELVGFVVREARGLLRFESAEDLVQAIHLRAVEKSGRLDFRGREPFFAWLHTLARNHLSDRRAHWGALKRCSGRLLRYTAGAADTADPLAVPLPAAPGPGPSTFADRREQIVLAVRTLDALLPRDRDLVRWTSEGLPLAEMAARLGVTYAAADQARRRALERFRRAFGLLSGR